MAKRYIYFVDTKKQRYIDLEQNYFIASNFIEIVNGFSAHDAYIYVVNKNGFQRYTPYIVKNGIFQKAKSYCYIGGEEE